MLAINLALSRFKQRTSVIYVVSTTLYTSIRLSSIPPVMIQWWMNIWNRLLMISDVYPSNVDTILIVMLIIIRDKLARCDTHSLPFTRQRIHSVTSRCPGGTLINVCVLCMSDFLRSFEKTFFSITQSISSIEYHRTDRNTVTGILQFVERIIDYWLFSSNWTCLVRFLSSSIHDVYPLWTHFALNVNVCVR